MPTTTTTVTTTTVRRVPRKPRVRLVKRVRRVVVRNVAIRGGKVRRRRATGVVRSAD